jgi:hypothetical protein
MKNMVLPSNINHRGHQCLAQTPLAMGHPICIVIGNEHLCDRCILVQTASYACPGKCRDAERETSMNRPEVLVGIKLPRPSDATEDT